MADGNAVCSDYEKMPIDRLEPGELGVLLARAGAGKTACLTHVALDYLLAREAVLHVCVDVVPDKVKLWYQKLLRDKFSTQPECKVSELQHSIEPPQIYHVFPQPDVQSAKVGDGHRESQKAGKV